MKAGIVCEGKGDFAVLRNVVCGALDIDRDDIIPVRPHIDETEKSQRSANQMMTPKEHSNWTLVKDECIKKEEIDKFIDGVIVLNDSRKILVIHLDTDVCGDIGYDVSKPQKSGDLQKFSQVLRNLVIGKINEWLGEIDLTQYVVYAIAIEETEAWLIPLYDKSLRKDTCNYNDPKKELNGVHKKKGLGNLTIYQRMQVLSDPIRKKKELQYCCKHNESLSLFIEELQTKVAALPMA